MNKVASTLKSYHDYSSLEVIVSTHKLEQKTRNKVKKELTQALFEDLQEMANSVGNAGDVIVTRIEKGIGLAFLTPKGYFPATIEITMKSTDMDIELAAQEFADKIARKAEETKEKNEAKLEKIRADEIKREAKRAERAAKLAKLAKLADKNGQ